MPQATTTSRRFSAQQLSQTGHAHGLLEYLVQVGDPASGMPIGKTPDNIRAAIVSETHNFTIMYPEMATAARSEGFDEIADWMETLAKAARAHVQRLQKTLDTLES